MPRQKPSMRGMLGWTSRARRSAALKIAAAVVVGAAVLAGAAMSMTEPPAPPTSSDDTCGNRTAAPDVRAAIELHALSDETRALALGIADDVWSESTEAPTLTIVVDTRGRAALDQHGLRYRVVVPDIDAVARAERDRIAAASVNKPKDWFAEYKRYEQVDAYLDTLAQVRPNLTQVQTLGLSLEERPIRSLRISTAGTDAPAFVINGGQHAREWISVMTTTCLADRLVRGYGRNDEITRLLDTMQVYVVPVANPDGYAYSWDADRYWRKNRRGGHGVDLNRNYPVAFGRKGSSDQEASPIYRGTHPFSEPEAQALRDLIRRVPVQIHLDYHSYSQLVLYPWSHTAEHAPDRARLARLAQGMATAIASTHGERYRVIEGAKLYPASGTLLDWVYGERDAASFVIELRPRSGDGFVLPPDQIVPTCDESLAATLTLAKQH